MLKRTPSIAQTTRVPPCLVTMTSLGDVIVTQLGGEIAVWAT